MNGLGLSLLLGGSKHEFLFSGPIMISTYQVVEDFGDKFEKPKTREFTSAMRRWGVDPKEKSMFLFTEVKDNVRLSSRNIGTMKMLTPRSLNLFDILNADKLLLTPGAVDFLNWRYGVDAEEEEQAEVVEG